MKRLFLFASIIFMGLLFNSCNSCKWLDCVTSNYSGQFRIVSGADGKDLVFGPNKIYDKNEIKFYTLNGTDTVFFDYEPANFPGAGYDSILYVQFFPQPDIAYMRLNNIDVDTINFSYDSYKTKCCGTITEITNFRFNNAVNIPGNEGTQAIRK